MSVCHGLASKTTSMTNASRSATLSSLDDIRAASVCLMVAGARGVRLSFSRRSGASQRLCARPLMVSMFYANEILLLQSQAKHNRLGTVPALEQSPAPKKVHKACIDGY